MDQTIVWAIRDARGMNERVKAFLWAVESRGVMFTSWKTAAADTGMTKSTYYRTRDAAVAAGLVKVRRRFGGATEYEVDGAAVKRLVPAKQDAD